MSAPSRVTWRHFQADIILCAGRWDRRSALSSRAVEELLRERGVGVDQTTVFRWVQPDAPALDPRCRPRLQNTQDSSRVDEPYLKLTKPGHDLSRAVASQGHTRDFLRRTTREADAAERGFRQVLRDSPTLTPRVLTVDQNAAYPPALDALPQDRPRPEPCRLRQCKYWNTMIEPAPRCVNRLVNPGLGLGACHTAQRTLQGDEAMHMLRTGQLAGIATGDVLAQHRVINQLCGVAASRKLTPSSHTPMSCCNIT
jgi:transposase, IS6 family